MNAETGVLALLLTLLLAYAWRSSERGYERAKADILVVLEDGEAFGFEIARRVQRLRGDRDWQLLPHGTLYRALHDLEARGLVRSWWEPDDTAQRAGRPRRRYYALADRP